MFTVGQKVWCVMFGEGVVTEIHHESVGAYRVVVLFKGRRVGTYTTDGKYSVDRNVTLFPYPIEITKVITKPSIDWEHVSSKFNYLAEDADGGVFLYEDKPYTSTETWMADNGDITEAHVLASYVKGACDWKESLVKRPEGDSHDD